MDVDLNTALRGSCNLLIPFLSHNKQSSLLKPHSLLKSSLQGLNPTSEKEKAISNYPKYLLKGEKWKHLGELELLKTVSGEKKAIFPSKSVLGDFIVLNCLPDVKDSKSVDTIC